MEQPAKASRPEARWPVALAILSVLALLVVTPDRIWLFPGWFPYFAAIAVLVPLVAVSIAAEKARWLRIERVITVLFWAMTTGGTVTGLAILVDSMVRRSGEIGGVQLLLSSIAVWVLNVLGFSLIYWQIDRGGPVFRDGGGDRRPDWLFPQAGAPPGDVPSAWRPTFVDYLYLSFSTAAAFSTTDVMPLTSRAKLAMMMESSIALATIVVVASRAINILGN